MKKTLNQLHNEFIEEYEFVAKRSQSTLAGYRLTFNVLMKLMPAITIEKITPETVKEFFRLLETRERQVGKKKICTGIKPATARVKL